MFEISNEKMGQINSLLNELPIKQLPLAQAIVKIIDECKVDKSSEKSSEKKK